MSDYNKTGDVAPLDPSTSYTTEAHAVLVSGGNPYLWGEHGDEDDGAYVPALFRTKKEAEELAASFDEGMARAVRVSISLCDESRQFVDRPWMNYPLGTKAHAVTGGCWTRVVDGWKWGLHGGVFPTPGGDACGRCIELPNTEDERPAQKGHKHE